jgi:hypothetical protein
MSEVIGYILFAVLFVVFGGLFVIMAFQSIFFSTLEGFVNILTKLGVAAIIPAGIYALLKWQKEHNGEQRLDGDQGPEAQGGPGARVGNSDDPTRGGRLSFIGQSLLSRSKEGSRSRRNGQGR